SRAARPDPHAAGLGGDAHPPSHRHRRSCAGRRRRRRARGYRERPGRDRGVTGAVGCVVSVLLAAPVPSALSSPGARIDSAVRRAFGGELRRAIVAVEVRRLSDGATLYRRNADVSMTPASTLKLATTAAALDAFGPDARW